MFQRVSRLQGRSEHSIPEHLLFGSHSMEKEERRSHGIVSESAIENAISMACNFVLWGPMTLFLLLAKDIPARDAR